MFGRVPVERPHGEVVVLLLPDSQLLFEIIERIELPHSIELLVIFPVTALHLTIVPGSEWSDQLMPDAQLLQRTFKQSRLRFLTVQTVCKLRAVVSLDAFDGIRELFHHMLDELGRCVGAMFLKGFQITETAVFVDECVLIEFLSFRFSDKAGSRNKLDIDLSSLPRILHLFVRF